MQQYIASEIVHGKRRPVSAIMADWYRFYAHAWLSPNSREELLAARLTNTAHRSESFYEQQQKADDDAVQTARAHRAAIKKEKQMNVPPNKVVDASDNTKPDLGTSSGMAVGSQVTNVTAHKVDSSEVAPANVADAKMPAQPGPRDGNAADPSVL